MRTIEIESWPRRDHYRLFRGFAEPHFALCANVDLSGFYPWVKERGLSFTAAIVYLISRAANEIPEFRYRIRGDEVVEHEVVNPSITILVENDVFSFCLIPYHRDFAAFATRAAEQIARVKSHPTLTDEPGHDDLLFMTALPWVAFTSFMHPLPTRPPDSVPRFAWGKRFAESGSLKMPLGVQAHHALMDGLHLSRYYELVQAYLKDPATSLGGDLRERSEP